MITIRAIIKYVKSNFIFVKNNLRNSFTCFSVCALPFLSSLQNYNFI